MRFKTFIRFFEAGKLRTMFRGMRLFGSYYRVIWLAAAARCGLLQSLARGSKSLDLLAAEMAPEAAQRDALEAWLGLGVGLKEIGRDREGYRLRGYLAKQLSRVEMDAVAALFEEVAGLHHKLIFDTPARLERGERWSLEDQDGALVARSSRTTEPIGFEAVDGVVSRSEPQRLLEVGAGSGTYIRYAAAKNSRLSAVGLELQADVAELANENLAAWGLETRARVEHCDVRQYEPGEAFDIITLQNNIYYFAVDERVALFRRLRGFLKPGGRLLVTTGCRGGNPLMRVLDLWSAATEGCGRLPTPEELESQLAEAGFAEVETRNLLPGNSYYAFVAT
jgi:SAM-dependent methyltransferase